MQMPNTGVLRRWRAVLGVLVVAASSSCWADLGASVTLLTSVPETAINPGEVATLQITLSNSDAAVGGEINQVAFNAALPGTLPNGLKVAATPSYACTDGSGNSVPTQGVLSASIGGQALSLSGGSIPVAGASSGTCVIGIPVTAGAGASNGQGATFYFGLGSGAVTGQDNATSQAVANSGVVTQSIAVNGLAQPVISKSFGSNPYLVLGGGTIPLTITITNSNSIALTGIHLSDVFPAVANPNAGNALQGVIAVAGPTGASAVCPGGVAPVFSAPSLVAGATSISVSGGTLAANASCTITVYVQANQTGGAYAQYVTNTIDPASQFGDDIGISAAAAANSSVTVVSPLAVSIVGPATLAQGQPGTFVITLTNSGTTALPVAFTDAPIDGLSPAQSYGLTASSSSNTCNGSTSVSNGGKSVSLAGGSVPAGGSCTVSIVFSGQLQTANTPQSFTNSLAAGVVQAGSPVNAAIVSSVASAAVTIYDTFNVGKAGPLPADAAPGSPVRYVVTVQNWSSSAMTAVTIADPLSSNGGQSFLTGINSGVDYTPTISGAGCGSVSASSANGAASANLTISQVPARTSSTTPGSCAVTFWAMTSTTAATGSQYSNSIAAGSVCTSGGTVCNGGGASSGTGTVSAVLAVGKTFSPAGPVSEGAVSRVTLQISNTSVNPLTSVTLVDNLPQAASGGQMRVSTPPNAVTTCGGSPVITAVAGSTSVQMNGATVPARTSASTGATGNCVLQVDVVAAAGSYTGAYQNTATATATQTFVNGGVPPVLSASGSQGIVFNSALCSSAAPCTKVFNPAAVTSGGRSTVTVHLVNSGALALSGVALTDPLPHAGSSSMVLASPANAYTTCNGTTALSAVPGSATLAMTGATIAGNGSCDVVFDVIATGTANWTNTLPPGSIVASGGISNQVAVSGTLAYSAPVGLVVGVSTNPSTLTFPGQTSQLTLSITNGSVPVTNLQLTDNFTLTGTGAVSDLPTGMAVAATPSASTNCPGGSVTATPGSTKVVLTGVSLAAMAPCTVTVNVTSTAVGGINDVIPASAIVTDQGVTNAAGASTSLTTQNNIGVVKTFTPNVVQPGVRSRLRITLYNPTALPLTSLQLTDTLPAGVTVPAGPNPVLTCSSGSVSVPASPPGGSVQLSGVSIPAASANGVTSCYAEIDVVGASVGDYTNTIPASSVTAVVGGTAVTNSQPATDVLHVKVPLVVNKAFDALTLDSGSPAGFSTGTDTQAPGAAAVLTIRLTNPNATSVSQLAFSDTLPANLVVASPLVASTTCGGTLQAVAAGTSVRLSGAGLAAGATCNVTVNVLSNIPGVYVNALASGSVTTFEGVSNLSATSAQLSVSNPPTVGKQFTPAVIVPGAASTLTIVLGNTNTASMTLASALTDTLPIAPGALVVANPPAVGGTCSGAVTAVAGSGSISYAAGATIPPGGCTITVNVTGSVAGSYNNNIPAGALATTTYGASQQAANAPLVISTLGYISGKVFEDNLVTPTGMFVQGTDTPIAGASIELHSGSTCAGPLVALSGQANPASTDALGNYLFSGLAAGTYTVCEPLLPAGTTNGATTPGAIVAVNGSSGTAGSGSSVPGGAAQIASIVLGAGSAGAVSGTANNNFAKIVPSTIAGTVFLDQNNNGIQDGGEAGASGVTLQLFNPAISSSVPVATTTTNNLGAYSFTGLQPGTYNVVEPALPSGASTGITTAGSVPNGGTHGTASALTTQPSQISGIVLPPDTTTQGNNFAAIPDGRTLSGLVFLDFYNTGIKQGNDYGLAGQALTLSGSDINGNPVQRSTTTASDGSYSFAGLPASGVAGYTVTEQAQPTGLSSGLTTAGSSGGTVSLPGSASSFISGINLAGVNTVSANNNFAKLPGPAPDLTVAKTHTPSSFAAGSSTGYYTITPSNVGSLPTVSGSTITVVDTLPPGITLAQTPTGVDWTCVGAPGASTFTCTTQDVIAAGAAGQVVTARVAVASNVQGQVLTNTVVISGGGEPAALTGNNTATDAVAIASSAGVSGRVWLDSTHNQVYNGASSVGEPGWTVQLLLGGVLVASTTTASDGSYSFANVAPGSGYQIRFLHPVTGVVWGGAVPNETGTPFQSGTTSGSTAGNGVRSGANPAGAVIGDGTLSGLTFLSGTTTVQQSLPIDPAGVVYDAVTRQPVAGAVITITGPAGFVPASNLVGGQASETTGTDGLYQFLLTPSAPAGTYRLAVTAYPAGYSTLPSVLIPACTATLSDTAASPAALVQASNTAPAATVPLQPAASCPSSTTGLNAGNQATSQYYTSFALSPGAANIVNNHIPLDPVSGSGFVLSKTGDRQVAQIGDTVRYTVEVRLNSASLLPQVTVLDHLPPGFTLVLGTVQINGVPAPNPLGGLGPLLAFNLGSLRGSSDSTGTAPQDIKLQYRVRVGVGAQQGNGINFARAIGCSVLAGCVNAANLQPLANSVQSNQAQYKVTVSGGVFTDQACVLGKIFVDCSHRHVQEAEELGIPGVRLYFEDGTYMVSDSEGKYSRCDMAPRSHVLVPDPTTLPLGAHLTVSSNRNLGDANSLFIDLKNGELHRADFIEGSCSNQVLEQVKARRTQGEVRSVETERPGGPALRFESKPPGYPQQGTDSANQPLVQPRQGDADAQ